MPSGTIRLFSIFVSMNGEICEAHQGSICTFIRLAGCNLRCKYCDTEYAQEARKGYQVSPQDLLLIVQENGCKNVTITGGEPMLQKAELEELCLLLLKDGRRVSVETNGSIDFDPIYHPRGRVNYVVDFKLPSSGMYDHMRLNNPWMKLRENDWIKFVVKDAPDYEIACATIHMLKKKGCMAQFAMSPVMSLAGALNVTGGRLLRWLRTDRIFDVVISVQLHKILDLSEPD